MGLGIGGIAVLRTINPTEQVDFCDPSGHDGAPNPPIEPWRLQDMALRLGDTAPDFTADTTQGLSLIHI